MRDRELRKAMVADGVLTFYGLCTFVREMFISLCSAAGNAWFITETRRKRVYDGPSTNQTPRNYDERTEPLATDSLHLWRCL